MGHRLVALHHDDDVETDTVLLLDDYDRLCTSVGSTYVLIAGHHCPPTDTHDVLGDLLVTGGDNRQIHEGVQNGVLVDVPDHRASEQFGHWLPGKPTAAHSGGYYRQDSHCIARLAIGQFTE